MVNCKFRFAKYTHGESFYTCVIENQQLPENNPMEIFGTHRNGKSDKNVTAITLEACKMINLPIGMCGTFPNLKVIKIFKSNLKAIKKSDLDEYKNLEMLSIQTTDVEYLPGDLFTNLKKLQVVWFTCNKLSFIEPNILDGLQNLKVVNFSGNTKYSKCFSTYKVYNPNASLDDVRKELFDQFYARFNINTSKDINKSKEELVLENQQLKDFRSILNEQVQKANAQLKLDNSLNQQLKESETKLSKQLQQSRNAERNLREKVKELEEDIQEFVDDNKRLERELQDSDFEVNDLTNELERTKTEMSKYKASAEFQVDLINDITSYIDDDANKDYKIIIDGKDFMVHKFLLKARSPTFAEFLKTNTESCDLTEKNISVDIFEKILKFIYTDELPGIDGTNFLNLFDAAEFLKIKKLTEFALDKALLLTNEENALKAYKLGHKYENFEIKSKALNQIKRKYPDVAGETFDDSVKACKIIKMIEEKESALKKIEEEFKSSLTAELENIED